MGLRKGLEKFAGHGMNRYCSFFTYSRRKKYILQKTIYVYIYIERERDYMYIYRERLYIYREREREKERERDTHSP